MVGAVWAAPRSSVQRSQVVDTQTTDWYVVDGVKYQSEEFYHQSQAQNVRILEYVHTNADKLPPCSGWFTDWSAMSQEQKDKHDTDGCDCPRSEIIYLNIMGVPQAVSVSIAAIGYTTQIRQYGFEGHDASFDSFQDNFVGMDGPYPGDPEMVKRYTAWVAENQPAVQWAIDFSDLRDYLNR